MNSYSVPDYTHAGIMAYNNRNNAYLWGRYRGGASVNNFKQEKIISDAGYHGVQYESTTLPIYLQMRDLGASLKLDISQSGTTFTNVVSASDLDPNNLGLFVKEWDSNAISVSFDYFYARKCISNEPTHGSWGTEESSW